MSTIESMTRAYIEAIYFTETGDSDQPSADAELSDYDKMKAHMACRNFLDALRDPHVTGAGGGQDIEFGEGWGAEQLGHDLWLTRNGHGAGFWDRPELYGEENAILFTRLAKAMGAHDSEFKESEEDTAC